MRLTFTALLGITLATLPALAAPIPKGEKKTTAEKLHGKWELVKGADGPPEEKFYVVFAKDGKMTLHVEPKNGGEKIILTGKYKAEGEKIDYEMEEPGGGKKQEILTIKKLTDTELITVDPDDLKEEFKRVKEKKDEEKKAEKM